MSVSGPILREMSFLRVIVAATLHGYSSMSHPVGTDCVDLYEADHILPNKTDFSVFSLQRAPGGICLFCPRLPSLSGYWEFC